MFVPKLSELVNSTAKKYLSEKQFQWMFILCLWFVFIGFVSSRALVSIAMVALLVGSVFQNGMFESLKKYFQRKELWVLSFYFLIVFASGVYSEDKKDWLNWVRIKLPYIALPIAFAPLLRLNEKKFILILYGFFVVIFLSSVFVLSGYYLNYNQVTESLLNGNGIPMAFSSHISHIRYTLIVTFAFFCCLYLYEKGLFLFRENEKWVQLFFLVFSFSTLHILSVRSALLALYIGILFVVIRFIFIRKKYIIGGIFILLILIIPYLAIQYIPSLHNKFLYMQYDMHQFSQGKVQNLSDGMRFISMKGGLTIAKQNFWFGVGSGDVNNELQKFYDQNYPQLGYIDRKPIHNQFIWVLAETGVIGLGVFLTTFFFPVLYRGNYSHWLVAVLHLILFSSFFTESTLEEQMGTGFYLTFLLLLINRVQKE